MKRIRKRIFEIVELDNTNAGRLYDTMMMVIILVSMIPLMMKESPAWAIRLDWACVCVFIVDYVLRILCADFKMGKGWKSFFLYPFTIMAIIDLLAILPTLLAMSEALRLLKVVRLLRAVRVLRFLKLFRYSKSIERVAKVVKNQKESLIAVGVLAVAFIFLSALIVFNVEPDTYENFFEAIYWATVSLTTVGYGDIYPVTTAGKLVTMASSLFGIAIVALPAGIITAGYMDELNKDHEQNNRDKTEE